MGAIIRLTKMPTKCSKCPFADEEIKYCRLRNAPIIHGKYRGVRMPLCPLMNEGEYLTKAIQSCGLLKKIKRRRKMKYKDLGRKEWFMFLDDEKHYQKDSESTYYCFEERGHHHVSGQHYEELKEKPVIRISGPVWNDLQEG